MASSKIYKKSELLPPQKGGERMLNLFALLPEDLYVKVNIFDNNVTVFSSDRLAIPYLKELLTHLPPHTKYISN